MVTAVVWAVSMLRSLRLRALVYSLPLPITVVLLTTQVSVDGAQLAGVALLVLFFVVVSWLHHQVHLPIIVADLGGVAVYVGLAIGVATFSPLPFVPSLLLVSAMWAIVNLVTWRWARRHRETLLRNPLTTGPADGLGPFRKLLVIFVGSVIAVALGGLLSGLIVTFPYSGVVVAIESRRSLPAFTRLFALNSLSLVAFMSGYYALSGYGEGIALATAWMVFSVVAVLLNLQEVRRASSRLVVRVRECPAAVKLHRRWRRFRGDRDPDEPQRSQAG